MSGSDIASYISYLESRITQLEHRVAGADYELRERMGRSLGHRHTGMYGDGPQIAIASGLSDYTGWVDWTPTITQSGNVTLTVNEAKYCIVGKVCHVQAKLTMTGSGTGNNIVIIGGQPAAMQPALYTPNQPIGTFYCVDQGVNIYLGILSTASSATVWQMYEPYSALWIGTTGAGMGAGLASTDIIAFSATYRVA